MNIDFYTAEAFTERPFHGAQIAVFPNASDLSDEQMQRLATETNLSETVFVHRKSHQVFELRVFSPLKEVDFAGHPMIATGHVLASIGIIDLTESPQEIEFIQKTGSVDAIVHGEPNNPTLIQFGLSVEAKIDTLAPSTQEIADSLGLGSEDIGNNQFRSLLVSREQTYLIVPVNSFAAIRKAVFNQRTWSYSSAASLMISQLLLFSTEAEEPQHDFHGRLVGPDVGIHDDPPIGSSIPAFAAYLSQKDNYKHGKCSFSIERGTLNTRQSILNVELECSEASGLSVKVGGPAISISKGSMLVPDLDLVR